MIQYYDIVNHLSQSWSGVWLARYFICMRCAESQNPLAALSFLKDIVVQSFFYQRDSGDNYKQGEIFNWKIAAWNEVCWNRRQRCKSIFAFRLADAILLKITDFTSKCKMIWNKTHCMRKNLGSTMFLLLGEMLSHLSLWKICFLEEIPKQCASLHGAIWEL